MDSNTITTMNQFSMGAKAELVHFLENYFGQGRGVGSNPSTGGGSTKGITANWGGVLPASTSLFTGTTLRVPERGGASSNFTLSKAYFRVEVPATGTTTVVIEKMSPDGDLAWTTAATVATLTITGTSDYEQSGSISVSVTTGDLLRIRFTAVAASGLFHVEVTGS